MLIKKEREASIFTVGFNAVGARFSTGLLLLAFLSVPLLCSAQSQYLVSVHELSIPPKAHEVFEKGAELLLKKDAAGSLVKFQRAVELYPGYYESYYEMGVADLALKYIADAECAFQKSIDLSDGRYVQSLFGLGAVLIYQGEFEEAEQVTRRGLELAPDSWSGLYYRAFALFHLDRVEEAEKNAIGALRQKNESTEILRLLADIHSREKNYRALLNDLDEYLQLDPNSPTADKVKMLRSAAQRLLVESQNTTALAQPRI